MCRETDEKNVKDPFLGRLFLSTRLFFGSNFYPAVLEYPCLHNVIAICLWGVQGGKIILKFLTKLFESVSIG